MIGYKHLTPVKKAAQLYEKGKHLLIPFRKPKKFHTLSFHSYEQYFRKEMNRVPAKEWEPAKKKKKEY